MKRLAVIQPHLTNTSREMFLELAEYCPLDLVFSPEPAGMGFKVAPIAEGPRIRCFCGPILRPVGRKFGWIQWSVAKYILRQRPGAVFINANPRYLTFWMVLLWAHALGIPAYAHGHGFYHRGRIGGLYKLMMRTLLKLVTSYICYAPMVRQAFVDNGFSARKLSVAHNSLINRFPVPPEEKTGTEPGVLFIGRLREESRLNLLVRAIERIRREDGLPLRLHVVGEGKQGDELRAEAREWPWAVFHGGVYDPSQIREISLDCFAGCYPGKAGLSVVHMMSLSLPVITHNDLRGHGPEPSFIRDGVSGWLYDLADAELSLYRALRALACDRAKVAEMRQCAFADYEALAHPSLAARIWAIIGGREKQEFAASSQAPVTHGIASSRHGEAEAPALAAKR